MKLVRVVEKLAYHILSAMDVGVTASFDFTGSPPFMVEYTEKRNNARASTRSARFNGHSGQIVLQPDQEGQYTYVNQSRCTAPLRVDSL